MNKYDLEVGQLVEVSFNDYRTGGTSIDIAMICMNSRGELCLSSMDNWFPVENLDDNLQYASVKVLKVYDRACSMDAWKMEVGNRQLLWETPEEYVEYTVEELEEILGKKIKIIK